MKNKGFTLIELLIVIAIIAVLAGATVPMFRVTKLQAQQARVSADLDTIKTASLMLHNDTGKWPATGVSTGADLVANTSAWPNWNGPYMDEWRNDPWGTAYNVYDSGIIRYVRSYGPDLVVGGTDNIQLMITPNTAI